MIDTLRWLLPALVPALVLACIVRHVDRQREPIVVLAGTFVFGGIGAALTHAIETRVSAFTGLDLRVDHGGQTGALLFLFALVAPLREAAKVAACWPAFRSRYFDEPLDGIVYAGTAALGFASVENALLLRHDGSALNVARAMIALPAHLFFACLWGYALGRAKRDRQPGSFFPAAWLGATACNGLYTHLVFGRGPGALVVVAPLLLTMGIVAFVATDDLRHRGDSSSRAPGSTRLTPLSLKYVPQPPSFRQVREALRRADRPIGMGWVILGAIITIGAMIAGLVSAVLFGHATGVDFSLVDERDVSTVGPVALLGAGLLAAFPLSGYLIARASGLTSLLEPALATLVAILATVIVLGLAAPVAVVFAVALAPIAFGLACAGAWVGRPPS